MLVHAEMDPEPGEATTDHEARLDALHAVVASHCGQIKDLFQPGALVTVVVRQPGQGQRADVWVSDDEPEAVMRAIQGLMTSPVRYLD